MRRRRIWSELVPLGELARSPVLAELARRRIELLVAVQPKDRSQVVPLVTRAREVELSIGLWPLLEDRDGRWLHPGNAEAFAGWIDELLSILDRASLTVDALALDLEPPILEVRRILDGDLGAARAWLGRGVDAAPHARLVDSLRERAIEVVAAVVPPVLLPDRPSRGWQRVLGTPIDGIAYDVVSAMLYTTLFEGYSAGVVRRADACALLSRFARLASNRFGAHASVSLGAVGKGALGDERTYRDASELAEDVGIAQSAGVDDLALFDLAGVLARPPIEPWLDALTETAASPPPPPSARAGAIVSALWVTGHALAWRQARETLTSPAG
jgi:hypothetical protein